MKKALVFLIACCASMVLLAQQPHWTPVDEGLYSGSTGIIAIVQIDGVEQTSTQMELAVFCGEECRGTAFTSEFPITHRYLAMLNVYGENGHELTFKAYDHANNQELLDMNPVVTVVFSEDGSGSLFEPLELNFATTHEITASVNPSTGGTVTGGGTYTHGATCTLTATANTGYTFVNWTENGTQVSTNAEYSFVVMGDRNLVTNFEEINGNGNLNGVFSVGENATVSFSQGNLQYQASTNTWRFATNQWDYIGEDNANVSATYNGWIDLFGWGTSGYNHGAVCYQPWNTSTTYSDYYAYGSGNYNLYDQTGTADWGYNAISNGGNQENSGWRTLTKEEWTYLFDTRITASSIRYAKAELNGVNGVILLPDDWNADYYVLNNTNERDADYSSNIISATQWDTLILHGAVFLPTAGIRDGTSVNYVGSDGFYWSASYYYNGVNSGATWYVCFYASGLWLNGDYGRYCGKSVRLVRSAQNYSYSITVTANPTEGGMVSGGGTYAEGAECTLTATANDGFVFVSWTENGEPVSTNATYSFEVNGARNLVANFALQGTITNHWIPIQTFENTMDGIGVVLIDGVEQQSAALELGIFCGEECRGSVLPEEEDGHWLYYFSMGGVTNETFSFRLYDHALQQELELTCFNEVPFEINAFLGDWDEPYEFQFSNNVLVTVSVNPEGAGEVTGAGEYPHGTTATLSATANTGFAFRDWSIDGETVSTEPTLTLTVEAPILVTANFDYVQEYSLSTGWNWWSSYIELSDIDGLTMLEEGLGESGVMIKTNGSYARRRPNNTWFGSLNSINNETGYKIQTSSNCTVVVRGSLADPADHPISINANGWTWIGYPVQASQSANAALSGFNPENKDMIKGQNGYARYDANSGTWKPSSFTLTPGKSYLYYSNATEAKSLVWNAGRSTASDPEHHWTPNQTFENTMDGIGIVVIDGEEQFTGDLELGIFCGDDCRGSVFAEDEGDHWFYYFSMGGVSGETFTFRLYNHATQEELDLVCNNEAVPFEINGFLGDWDVPYVIDFTSNSTQTFTLPITGYGNSAGGYYLIAPPFDNINPADIEGMTQGDFDLYYFDQSESGEEWRNYEAEPFNLESGKGYLYAHKTDVTLSFTGTPYNGNGQVTLSKTEGVPFAGWNLVGNPFAQTANIGNRSFYVMREDGAEIIAAETNEIAPMQGIFVIADDDGETLTFSTSNNAGHSPRIVLSLLQGRNTVTDRAIISFGNEGNLPKMMLHPNSTKLYIPDEGKDYAVMSRNTDNTTTPVGFKAAQNGSYTICVDIENLDLDYLHLVDSKTGADVDLLLTPSYTFEARVTDNAERFLLVYATTTGINEGFAFLNNSGSLTIFGIDGEATLQVVDVLGHILSSETFSGSYEKKLNVAPGVYLLRLINGDNMKVQKNIIK